MYKILSMFTIVIFLVGCSNNALNETNKSIESSTKIVLETITESNSIETEISVEERDKVELVEYEMSNEYNNNLETISSSTNEQLKFYIDENEVDVKWEDNDSMKQIRELAKNNPLVISAHQYGGFEQVGEIGQNIVSNNIQMTTEIGDIVLYAGNNIVVFYGSNSWSYTKLGKIIKSSDELKRLLNKSNVKITISYQ